MRSHYCGQVNETLIDKEVEIFGWVHRRRDHGGVIFIDLRDREGLVQAVFNPDSPELFSKAGELRNEYVVCLKGKVRKRPEGTANAELPTGQIEIACQQLEILNRSEPLPFQIDEYANLGEEIRLRYRYLDLRRPEVRARFQMRAKITQIMRQYLDGHKLGMYIHK